MTTLRRAAALWLVTGMLWLLATPATAQEVQLAIEAEPHFAGVPVAIELTAAGFEEEPQPEVRVEPPPAASLALLGVHPSVQTQITFINGRLEQSKTVEFVYRYRLVAERAGSYDLGPFEITQNGVTRTVGPSHLRIVDMPTTDRLRLELDLPEGKIYPGERVPITLEVWIDADLRERLAHYEIRVPLFDRKDGFRFIDPDDAEATSEVEIRTDDGLLRLRARSRREQRGGRRFLVLSLRRTAIALRPGRYELGPARMIADEATRMQRDLFGQRRATRTRKLKATGRPVTVVVDQVPETGRLPSFAGAVGRGFSLEVTADRSVVQVGDPITLKLTLRGDGNLEAASLPPLSAEGLLPARDFRVPDGDLPGTMRGEAKEFSAVIRVNHQGVREIPALAYSFFDPETEAYETVRSRPISLSVGEAVVVSADDVVSSIRPPAPPSAALPAARAETAATPPELTGADLAIARDPARLLRDDASTLRAKVLPATLYAASALLLGLALVDRRRRDRDPVEVERRRRLRQGLAALGRAGSLSSRERAREVARILREMRAAAPDSAPPDLDALLGDCDARSFAPSSATDGGTAEGATSSETDIHRRALALARAMLEAER